MTVAQFIEHLQKQPQDAEVVLTGFDHTYRRIRTTAIETAVKTANAIYEDDPSYALEQGEARVNVVVIGR